MADPWKGFKGFDRSAQFGCTDNAVCSNRPRYSTMAGLTGLSCVSVSASVLTTDKMSSACRFGCTSPYVPLQFVVSGDTMITGGCWNTAVPTACSTSVVTTSSSGDSSSKTSTSTTCSTSTNGVTLSTATLAYQSCAWGDKLAIVGGPETCRALCPNGFTATTSSSDAFCTLTPTPLPSSLSLILSTPNPSPPPSSFSFTPLPSSPPPVPIPSPKPSPGPAATPSPKGKKVVIVNGTAVNGGRKGRAVSSRGFVVALLGSLLVRLICC